MKVSELNQEELRVERDKLYDELEIALYGEKLPCDLRTTEGLFLGKYKKITRRLLLRLIRQKDLLIETENKAVNKWLFTILERYKHLDFSDVPLWTKKSQMEAKA